MLVLQKYPPSTLRFFQITFNCRGYARNICTYVFLKERVSSGG